MSEDKENLLAVGNNENSSNVANDSVSEIRNLRNDIFDKFNQQSIASEDNKNNNEQKLKDIMEKLQAIQETVSKNQTDLVLEPKSTVALSNASSCQAFINPTEENPRIAKSFVLKHIFINVEKFEEGGWNGSEKEEHFGVEWCINLVHEDDNLEFFLHIDHPGKDWKIKTEYYLKIVGPKKTELTKKETVCFQETDAFGFDDFLEWERMKKDYLVDGNLTAEIHVKIIETKGLRKEKFRCFDESVEEVSDIVVAVKDRKFYVNRTFLAAQSSFFKALLLGNFAESRKSEVPLTGIDPEDFHFFLEVLYGEAAIDETNVEGIALLADMYDAPTAIRRCEEFLLEKSKKTLKRKLHMSDRYNLGALKKRCLAGIKTLSDVRSVVPSHLQDFEHSTVSALLEKAMSVGKS